MNGQLFEGIKQWEFDWQGRKAKLPVFYYDTTSLTAIYTASTKKVKALLPHPDMRLSELFPGRCLMAITAFEYRKTDIDPYNEFSIAFPISFGSRPLPGLTVAHQMAHRQLTAYVWQLPVTTEIARVGGCELYGYPKFVADIDFHRADGWIRCDLTENGQRILSLKGRMLRTKRGKRVRYVTYSVLDGIPLRANVVIDLIEHARSRGKKAATLELGGTHHIAETLSGLGLSKNPLVYEYSPVNQGILFGGRNLMNT